MAQILMAKGVSLNFDQWKFGVGAAKTFDIGPKVFIANYSQGTADAFGGRGFTYDQKGTPTGAP